MDLRVAVGQVAGRAEGAAADAGEAVVVEGAADDLAVDERGVLDRNFHEVEAEALDLGEERDGLGLEGGGPEPGADAEFHRSWGG